MFDESSALWGLLAKQESLSQLSGGAGSWPGANDTTSTAATADGTSTGEDQPPGPVQYSATTEPKLSEHYDQPRKVLVVKFGLFELAQHSATTEPVLAEYSVEGAVNGTTSAAAKSAGEARPPGRTMYSATIEVAKSADETWLVTAKYGATDTTSAAATAAASPAVEGRPPGTANLSSTTQSERAVSSDEAGLTGSRPDGTTSATAAAVAKSADEARPPGFAHNSATIESALVLVGRVEQGVVKPSEEVIFLPTHTASSPCTGKVFTVEMRHYGSGQEQHASIWRWCGAHSAQHDRGRRNSSRKFAEPARPPEIEKHATTKSEPAAFKMSAEKARSEIERFGKLCAFYRQLEREVKPHRHRVGRSYR